MATLTEMLGNPKFRELLFKADSQSPVEKAVSASLKEDMRDQIPIKEIRAALEKIDLGMGLQELLEHEDTSMLFKYMMGGEDTDLGPASRTLNKLLIIGGIQELRELLLNVWMHNYSIRNLVSQGDLAGLSDPTAIIVATAAWKTRQAAEQSSFNRFRSRHNDDWDDDIDSEYRYNTQDAEGVGAFLDLENKKPLEGMMKVVPLPNGSSFPVDCVRAQGFVELSWEDNAGVVHTTNIVSSYKKSANAFIKGLPRAWFGEIVGTDDDGRAIFGEFLREGHLQKRATTRVWDNWRLRYKDGKKLDKPLSGDPLLDPYTLNCLISSLLDAEIPPTHMAMNASADSVYPSFRSVYEGGVLDGNPRFYVSGKEPTEKVVDAEYTVVNTPPADKKDKAPSSTALTFPVTLSASVQGNTGKYRCMRCEKKGLNKNQMKAYEPHGLPEGMPPDSPGLEESQKWAMSCVCGACRNDLLDTRRKACANWTKTVPPVVKDVVEAVPADLLKQQEEYTEAWTKSEADIAVMEAEHARQVGAIKALEDSKVDVPEVLVKKAEEIRNNIQAAKGVSASIENQMAEVAARITAHKTGTVLPETRENTQKAQGPAASITRGPGESRAAWRARKKALGIK